MAFCVPHVLALYAIRASALSVPSLLVGDYVSNDEIKEADHSHNLLQSNLASLASHNDELFTYGSAPSLRFSWLYNDGGSLSNLANKHDGTCI
jgi:hypothetical protein